MRWVFITLLLLNALIFSVQWLEIKKRDGTDAQQIETNSAAPRLLLLSEFVAQSSKKGSDIALIPSARGEKKLCDAVGSFESEVIATQLMSELKKQGVSSEILAQEVRNASDYWVYLEPMESRNVAIKRLRELQVANVDSFLISQGPLANGISLGLFKNQESARNLQQLRISQGYSAKLAEVERSSTEYWLSWEEMGDPSIANKVKELASSKGYVVEYRQIACKGVASK